MKQKTIKKIARRVTKQILKKEETLSKLNSATTMNITDNIVDTVFVEQDSFVESQQQREKRL